MIKTNSFAILDGYGSGETNFIAQLGILDAQVQFFDSIIFEPILDVLNSPDQSAVLTIIGHSDRVDTEGLSREQRRLQELSASEERANNAAETVKQIIRNNSPELALADVDTHPQLGILRVVAGAALLMEAAVDLSEEQRRRNRRVEMVLTRFRPG